MRAIFHVKYTLKAKGKQRVIKNGLEMKRRKKGGREIRGLSEGNQPGMPHDKNVVILSMFKY